MFSEIVSQGLQKLTEFAGQAEGFLFAQVPLLCNEIVRWGIVSNLLGLGIFTAFFCVLFWSARYVNKHKPYDSFDANTSDRQVAIVVLHMTSAAMWIGILAFGCQAVKILVAPRLYLMEQLQLLF